MVNIGLTPAAIDLILRSHNSGVEPPKDPVVQCSGRKLLSANPNGEPRYRLSFSDGTQRWDDSHSPMEPKDGMLCKLLSANPNGEPRYRLSFSDGTQRWDVCTTSTQTGPRIHEGEMVENDVLRLTKFLTQNQPNNPDKVVIVVIDFIKLGAAPSLIGSPVLWSNTPLARDAANNLPYQANNQSGAIGKPAVRPGVVNGGAGRGIVDNVNPIVGLSPYQNKWKIRARVGQKFDVKKYSNAKGPGELFSIDLIDNSGEIRATAFNDDCKRLYPLLNQGCLYYISGGRIKSANKKFTTIKNDYELTFDKSTEIIPCEDENGAEDIPNFCFNFTKINNIGNVREGEVIDVIGIVKSCGDLGSVNTKDGRQLPKRVIQLVDKDVSSNAPVEVALTLWAEKATGFVDNVDAILALKNVRINEFMGGVSMHPSLFHTFGVHLNPDIPVCAELRMWYDNEGRLLDPAVSLSARQGDGPGGNSWIPIEAADTAFHPSVEDLKEYFTVKAVVTFVKHDTCLYQGCPGEGCKKKVIDSGDGQYRCEKCNQDYNSFKYILMLSACITDFSGQKWVTMFSETGEKFLGITTEQLGNLKDNDPDAFVKVFEQVTHKPFQFRIGARGDNWNDEQRVRWTVMSVTPLNVVEYTKYLNEQSDLFEAN